jgi:hypothetical protein
MAGQVAVATAEHPVRSLMHLFMRSMRSTSCHPLS